MTRYTLMVQRRLLVVVLVVIILLPIFLFLQGTEMNSQFAKTVGARAVDQILQQANRQQVPMLREDDLVAFRWFAMSQQYTSGDPAPFSLGALPRGIPGLEGGNGLGGSRPPDLLITMPAGSGKGTTTIIFPLADTGEETRKRLLRVLLEGGEVTFRSAPKPVAAPPRPDLAPALVSENINNLVRDFAQSNNRSLLRMSLVGALLLLGLGTYIVVLNERGRRLQSQLEREKGLAYVGTLAAGLAHEIRNPLSSVKMNIQMIEQKLSSLGDDQYAYLKTKVHRILQETTRLENSISDFLRFARPAPLSKKKEVFNDVVDEAVEFLLPEGAQNGVEVVKSYAPQLPEVDLDRAQFGGALRNLIINARQALPNGSGRIEVITRRNGSSVEVTVADNGLGVPEETREKLFDVFFTTKPDGTGLGLSVVRQIAEAHGGQARLEKSAGPGAAFTISVPA